ncbi:hypothetical protein LIER_15710 [Lithospermum erythrorhizon]|uniref:Mitochondrial fission protein ELM1 n=1 Tax=Lithospermum erythrorhizon TaxID=34254 RepID=A0AAV3Q3V8_LITER
MGVIRRAIVIGNGVAGAENQCLALVRALGLSHKSTLYRVSRPRGGLNDRLHWLPVSLHQKLDNAIRHMNVDSISKVSSRSQKVMPMGDKSEKCILEANAEHISNVARETFDKDGPVLLVASGRDTIPIATSVKQLAPENVFLTQIQHPRSNLDRFDLVITPRHDYYPLTPEAQKHIPWFLRRWVTPREPPGKNVVLTIGALHLADSVALQGAASAWLYELAPLPKPLVVVNIGGPTRHCRYGADLAKQLTSSLLSVLPTCGSVRVSFSRRTPRSVSDVLMANFHDHQHVSIWNGQGPNPHMGHLAWADAFVITADSVSMLSEACSTGKPVYVIGADRCTWKFADFQKSLQSLGMVRPFAGEEDMSSGWSYSPLHDTEDAAHQVIEALSARGWKLQPH